MGGRATYYFSNLSFSSREFATGTTLLQQFLKRSSETCASLRASDELPVQQKAKRNWTMFMGLQRWAPSMSTVTPGPMTSFLVNEIGKRMANPETRANALYTAKMFFVGTRPFVGPG